MTTLSLAGQPNVGKSSIFNTLTGMRQHVGNWPGKTVDRKEGLFNLPDKGQARLIDLPGIYSLTSSTIEEVIARDFILQKKPDVIINVVDASNLERNLYLTTEIIDLGQPVIIALNMTDLAERKGYHINMASLAKALGLPVVPVVATRKHGLDKLRNSLNELLVQAQKNRGRFHFSAPVERIIENISECLGKYNFGDSPRRWLAIKLLEGDSQIKELVATTIKAGDLADLNINIERQLPNGPARLAEERYRWINDVLDSAVRREHLGKLSTSDRIDLVLTNRWLGVPVFLAIIAGAFFVMFRVALPLQNAVSDIFTWLSHLIQAGMGAFLPVWLIHMLTDGVLAGVGTALSFVPLVAIMFAIFGLLEDVGYFARAAFVMDRWLAPIGLPGKAFISLLMGYGCNVPAIMAARTSDDERGRLLSILVTPLTICSARQVLAIALVAAFFLPQYATWVLFGLFAFSFALICLVSFILKNTVLKAEPKPFCIELPMYRWPHWKNILTYVWQKTRGYLKRAGTLIAVVSALIWALSYFPGGSIDHSFLSVLGHWLSPLGRPFGFADWRLTVALISGFVAKEVVLATLGVLYHANESNITAILARSIPFAGGLSFLVFSMFYIPCLATTFSVYTESGSLKWTILSAMGTLVLAALLSLAAYHLALVFS